MAFVRTNCEMRTSHIDHALKNIKESTMSKTTVLATTNNTNSHAKNSETAIKVMELFAGVGGFRVGLENATKNDQDVKYDVIWSNQFEPSTKTQHASDVYCQVFGERGHTNQDITTVETESIPDCDMLVGGFPCQDYSVMVTTDKSKGLQGRKGILWWEIYRILAEKGDRAPKYLLLENVDRLISSPSSQKGRDFAVILASLDSLGYGAEWRVLNAGEYGMPQKRRRVFIHAFKKDTPYYRQMEENSPSDNLSEKSIITRAFPVRQIDDSGVETGELHKEIAEVSANFNRDTPKKNAFLNTGYMLNGAYCTARTEPDYQGKYTTLGDILQPEETVHESFYVTDAEELEKWKYKKGPKSFDRVNQKNGQAYTYSEGGMHFPDRLDIPSRTIITGEGGVAASRTKHIIQVNDRYRRLTPMELERLNMFPDNHTAGTTESKRAFLMGNALVIGIVEKLGAEIKKLIVEERKEVPVSGKADQNRRAA